jgi:hypothetical protein
MQIRAKRLCFWEGPSRLETKMFMLELSRKFWFPKRGRDVIEKVEFPTFFYLKMLMPNFLVY